MYREISHIIPGERIRFNEPMCMHTTFRIGGPADVLVIPSSPDEIINVLGYCRQKNVPLFVFGLGSNLLVRDKGIRGVAMKLGEGFKKVAIKGEKVYAEAGIGISELSREVALKGLSGLEFAEGIPGSLGGAIVMNAGAYGGEMKDVLGSVSAIDHLGNRCEFAAAELGLGYRSSIFQKGECIIISAIIELKRGDPELIAGTMEQYALRRRAKQPLDLPSAGSTFKRPPGFFVGPLVEQLGLKGFQIGDAQVSTKHAGFIVNRGNAKAEEVLQLIAHIQEAARQKMGVELHPEVRLIGEE